MGKKKQKKTHVSSLCLSLENMHKNARAHTGTRASMTQTHRYNQQFYSDIFRSMISSAATFRVLKAQVYKTPCTTSPFKSTHLHKSHHRCRGRREQTFKKFPTLYLPSYTKDLKEAWLKPASVDLLNTNRKLWVGDGSGNPLPESGGSEEAS